MPTALTEALTGTPRMRVKMSEALALAKLFDPMSATVQFSCRVRHRSSFKTVTVQF